MGREYIVGLASSAVLFVDSLYIYKYGCQLRLSFFVYCQSSWPFDVWPAAVLSNKEDSKNRESKKGNINR